MWVTFVLGKLVSPPAWKTSSKYTHIRGLFLHPIRGTNAWSLILTKTICKELLWMQPGPLWKPVQFNPFGTVFITDPFVEKTKMFYVFTYLRKSSFCWFTPQIAGTGLVRAKTCQPNPSTHILSGRNQLLKASLAALNPGTPILDARSALTTKPNTYPSESV